MKNIVESIKNYFTEHPQAFGLLFMFIGSILFFGAFKKWKWVLDMKPNMPNKILYRWLGEKYAVYYMYLLSVVMILGGLSWYVYYR